MDTNTTNTNTIVEALTKAIVEHRLHPGTKLAEQKLADHFGVSRTLVRQALFQLSQNRLIRLEPARGAFVAAPSVTEARQVFAVRRMLEAEIVRALAREATPGKIKALEDQAEISKTALANPDLTHRTEVLGGFHLRMAELLGNAVLVQMMVEILSRCSLITLMYQSDMATGQTGEAYEDLVKAIASQDEALAVQLLHNHLQSVEADLTFDRKIPSNDIAMALA